MGDLTAIILAGGFATRLWPLTENRAKPLVLLAAKPLLSHIIKNIPEEIPVIISTNKVFEDDFYRWRNDFPDRNIEIFIEDSENNESKKGALAAVAAVIEEKKLSTNLLLLAGDNYFGFPLTKFLQNAKNNPLLALYDIQSREAAKQFGVVIVDKNNTVTGFQEKPQDPQSTLVSTGCYFFPKNALSEIISYSRKNNDNLGGVFESYLEKNIPIHAFSFSEPWFDIGSFSALLHANKILQGTNIIEEKKVIKKGNNEIIGATYLGENTHISDSLIDNCIILDHCVLKNVILRDCIIGEHATLSGIDLHTKIIRANTTIHFKTDIPAV